jgi:hypothetical protein
VEERLKSIEFPVKSLKPAKAIHQGMNSGLGFRGFVGFRVLGFFFFFLAYAITPSSLLNIGFTAKVFLGFQNPCRRRLAAKAQRVRQKRKFHYCNKTCQVCMRERERERERERYIYIYIYIYIYQCVCVGVGSESLRWDKEIDGSW